MFPAAIIGSVQVFALVYRYLIQPGFKAGRSFKLSCLQEKYSPHSEQCWDQDQARAVPVVC
ncbi:hypothetical protein, partial [Kaarinaea lacus]